MRLEQRLERLEARAPKVRRRTILVWIDAKGRRTKAADTDPDLPDPGSYDAYISPYGPETVDAKHDASQTS